MTDNYVYNTSLEEDRIDMPFVSRRQVYILDDNNSSNYNGTMTFNTSSTSNSGLYADWKNGFLSIPVVVSLKANALTTMETHSSSLAVCLKNATTSLIHSMSIEYNSNTVIQTTNFSNHYITWKQICEMSDEDVKKWGDVYNIHPDDGGDETFETVTGPNGMGVSNCSREENDGLQSRQVNFSFDPSDPTFKSQLSIATCNKIAKNYSTADNTSKARYWFYTAQIKLSDLSDFFGKLSLSKNAFFKMTFNLNTSKQTIFSTQAAGATGGANTLATIECTSSILQHGSSVVMVNTDNWIVESDDTFTLELAVGRNSDGITHPVFSNARLYVNLYTLDPTHEQQLLSFKNKVFEYNDIYQYSIQTTASNVNSLLTNGLSNLRGILLIPYVGTNSNKVSSGDLYIAPYQSPFACQPAGNSCRDIVLTNINVLVGGASVLQQAQNYDYEAYVNELSACEAINGGLSTGLTNGQISFSEFQLNKRFYFFDLSRRMPSEQGIPKSVQLQCQIEKPNYMSANDEVHIMCFLIYSKKFGYDLESGVVLDI